jgi:hypothetical protein
LTSKAVGVKALEVEVTSAKFVGWNGKSAIMVVVGWFGLLTILWTWGNWNA